MSASLKLNREGLEKIVQNFQDPSIKTEINRIIERKAIAAMVGQAIADNFNQQGPGWAPLKASTIRRSVSKAVHERIKKMTDKELIAHEAKARKAGEGQHRMILRKTGLLMASATTPGARGNVWKTEGTTLIWGTDLIYAGVHNNGYPAKNIPKREFMKIRESWMTLIKNYVIEEAYKIIQGKLLRGLK